MWWTKVMNSTSIFLYPHLLVNPCPPITRIALVCLPVTTASMAKVEMGQMYNRHISLFEIKLTLPFLGHYYSKSFQTLHDCNLALGLQFHCRFDDRNFVLRSQVCQKYKLCLNVSHLSICSSSFFLFFLPLMPLSTMYVISEQYFEM